MEIPLLAEQEEHFFISGPEKAMRLFLRFLPSERPFASGRRAVLYVHGATFPSALSIAHRFDGRSWRDALCEVGFDVWGLDFYGFGHSDRYFEMEAAPDANAPLCLAEDAAAQLGAAVCFILEHQHLHSLSLIAHSWGSMVAARLASEHAAWIDRMVLFAPIARRDPPRYTPRPNGPAWHIVTVEDQWARFTEDVPPEEPPVLSRIHFDDWAQRYLDSDPDSRARDLVGVKTPSGPFVEILRAWHGELAYEPARVHAPIAIIRGAWDGLITDADAKWLFDAFHRSSSKRDIKIARGTHLMHLETMRPALWHESATFLLGDDTATVSINRLPTKEDKRCSQ